MGTPLQPGSVVAGRYEIKAPLGRGGMGMVFLAHDRLLVEQVALKVLRPDLDVTPELERRFIDELKLARTVSHRNVCRIHEYGVDEGLRYISMAYVEGRDLKRLLQERGGLPPKEAFPLAIAIAEGLQAIHDEGIVHRDLKPQNVMVDARGVPRLMDFGIARPAEPTGGRTDTGHVVGTPEYMSPEQIRGQRLDARSDVYALGILVHELFTGRTPFAADTPADILVKHLQETPRFEASRLPPAVAPVLAGALDKNRDKRFASAAEMARALAAAQAAPTQPVDETGFVDTAPARRTPVVTAVAPTVPQPPRRSPVPLALGAVALAAAGTAAWFWSRPAPAVEVPPTTIAATPVTTLAPTPEPATPAPTEAPAAREGVVPPPVTRPAATPAPAAPATPDPRVPSLLREAEAALLAKRYAEAIALYDRVLELDPANAPATRLRTSAVEAQVASSVVAPPATTLPAAGRTLVATGPHAKGPDAVDKEYAAGFDDTGLEVTRDTGAAALPGEIRFAVQPEQMKAGGRYSIVLSLHNAGAAPITVRSLTITTKLNGKGTTAPVPPQSKTVAPHATGTLVTLTDYWPDAVATFTLEATVKTDRGETYTNSLVAR